MKPKKVKVSKSGKSLSEDNKDESPKWDSGSSLTDEDWIKDGSKQKIGKKRYKEDNVEDSGLNIGNYNKYRSNGALLERKKAISILLKIWYLCVFNNTL